MFDGTPTETLEQDSWEGKVINGWKVMGKNPDGTYDIAKPEENGRGLLKKNGVTEKELNALTAKNGNH